ncbi:DNA polymerase [Bacillus sp. WC2502]|uniref:DNA polymerase n=1 Tax=Bacillus sp. WC2502 TaxID=3461401 RepID=UPI004044E6BE
MASKYKKSHKPIKLMTLDTETRGFFGEIFRVGIYDGEKYNVANTFSTLKSIITRLSKKYDLHIFIHNLDFDLGKMAGDVLREVDLDESIFINNNVAVYKTSLVETQIREELEIISQPITFHDSLKLIGNKSLASICEDFKLDVADAKISLKQHILNIGWARDEKNNPTSDPDKYHKQNSEGYYFMNVDPYEDMLNLYLKNDCVALHRIIMELLNISGLELDEFLKCPTTASLALKVYKQVFAEDYKQAVSTKIYRKKDEGEFLEKFIRDAYYGGRTEVFVPRLKNGFHYDVTSLYPYIMKTNEFPIGRPEHLNGEAAELMFKRWLRHGKGKGFIEVDIFIPDMMIPPLPRKDKEGSQYKKYNKLIFPVGNLHGVYTYEEIGLALEMGAEIKKVYQGVHFNKSAPIFKAFIEHFEVLKRDGEGSLRTFAKLMQNSLYGKFGMIRERETMLPLSHEQTCIDEGYPYIIRENELIKDGKFILAIVPSHAEYIQPHIAAYVTSLSRILLFRGLIKQHEKGDVNYCDTDSIACQAEMDAEDVHGNEYGKWKLEGLIEKGLFIQPKVYYERHSLKSSPIKKKEVTEKTSVMAQILFKYPSEYKTTQMVLKPKEERKAKGIPGKFNHILTEEWYETFFAKLATLQEKLEKGEEIKETDITFTVYGEDNPDKKLIKFGSGIKSNETNFNKEIRITKKLNLLNMQKRKMDYIRNTSTPHKVCDF